MCQVPSRCQAVTTTSVQWNAAAGLPPSPGGGTRVMTAVQVSKLGGEGFHVNIQVEVRDNFVSLSVGGEGKETPLAIPPESDTTMAQDEDQDRLFGEKVKALSTKHKEQRGIVEHVSELTKKGREDFLLQFNEKMREIVLPGFGAVKANAESPEVVRVQHNQEQHSAKMTVLDHAINISPDIERMRVQIDRYQRREALSTGLKKPNLLPVDEFTKKFFYGLLEHFLREAWGVKKGEWED